MFLLPMPTKLLGNDGAGHDNSDAEISVTHSDDNAEFGRKKERLLLVVMYRDVKLWGSGNRAEQPEEWIY